MPKAFWNEERYQHLTPDAIVLYTLMLDRMNLSAVNGWVDKNDQVYVYFTIDEIQKKLRCSRSKAVKLKRELLQHKLIRFEAEGKSDPHRIYVLSFFDVSKTETGSENGTSPGSENELREVRISSPNKTKINNTEHNNNLSVDGYDEATVEEIIRENVEYDILVEREYDMETIDSLISLMTEAICSGGKEIHIGNETVPKSMVRSRFMKYTKEDLDYVLYCMKSNTSDIRNIRSYMLTALYNAPATKSLFYRQKVLHDFPQFAAHSAEGGGCL